MDVSAIPYFYAVIVDVLLLAIGGFVQWRLTKLKTPRQMLAFGLTWLAVNLIRSLLVVLSAGTSGAIDRMDVVWLIRAAVVVEHTILLACVYPFLMENTTLGSKQ